MTSNAAVAFRTYERHEAVITEKQKEPFIDKVVHWMEREEPAGQRLACYCFLAVAALYFIGGVLRALF